MCFNSNCPTVWVEKSKIGFQDGSYGCHFGFPISMISYFPSTLEPVVSFNLIRLVVCEMSKTNFQDGSSGGHLRFLIDTILAHFDPEVVLLLQSKFWLKSTKCLGRECRKLIFKMAAVAAILIFDRLSLVILCLLGTTMFLIKFQLNWITAFRGNVQNTNSQHFSLIN